MTNIEFLDLLERVLLAFKNINEYIKSHWFQSEDRYCKIFKNSLLNRVLGYIDKEIGWEKMQIYLLKKF